MCQAHVQVEALEDPPVDHPGDAQCRFHRVANQLGEPVIALAVSVRNSARVDEDKHVALGEKGPKVVVDRVIEFFAAAAGADGNTWETQVFETALRLLRGVGESERDRPETVQPPGAFCDVAGEFVVAAGDGGGRQPSVF